MTEITRLLRQAESGDREAADRLFSVLYDELHRLARSRMNRSGPLTLMETTALVHESWLRMQAAGQQSFPDRAHFLAYAAKAMRSVAVDIVRSRRAERHGGHLERVTWDTQQAQEAEVHDAQVLRVHEALDDLAAQEPRLAQVVELRYFGGLSEAEIAAILGVTERTVQRDWKKARLFLSLAMQ